MQLYIYDTMYIPGGYQGIKYSLTTKQILLRCVYGMVTNQLNTKMVIQFLCFVKSTY